MHEVNRGDVLDWLRAMPDASADAILCDPPYGLEFMGREWDGADGFRRTLNKVDAGRENVSGRASRTGPEYKTRARQQTGAGFSKPGIGERDTSWPSFTGGEFGGSNPTCANCGGRARGQKKCSCGAPDWRVNGAAPVGQRAQMRTFQDWCEAWATEALRVLRPGAPVLAFGGTRTFHRLAVGLEDAGFEIRDTLMWLYGQGFPKSLDVSKAIDKEAGAERTEIVGEKNGHEEFVDRDDAHAAGGRSEGWGRPWKDDLDAVAKSHMRLAPATPAAVAWDRYGTALKPAWEPIMLARKPLDGTVAHNCQAHGVGGLAIDACRVDADARPPLVSRSNHKSDWQGACLGPGLAGSIGVGETDTGRWPANVLTDGSDEVVDLFPDAPGQIANISFGQERRKNQACYGAMKRGSGEASAQSARRVDAGSAVRFFYAAKASGDDRWLFCRTCGAAVPASQRKAHLHGVEPREVSHIVQHPTVKPLSLTEYLARLTLPPDTGRARRILVPFAGTGSEMVGALRAGWDEVLGCEQDADYAAMARARCATPVQAVRAPRAKAASRAPADQPTQSPREVRSKPPQQADLLACLADTAAVA